MRLEWKILRKMYGPTELIDRTCRNKTNEELDNEIILGHLKGVPVERSVKKIYKRKPTASRPGGRPKIRRMDTAMRGIQAVKLLIGKGEHRTEMNVSQLLSRPKLIWSCSV
jgi:hypothetical protein